MNRADGIDCYQKALRQGQRDYREKMNAGQSPFCPYWTIFCKRPCGEPDPARPGRDPAGAARWYQDLGPHSGVCVQLMPLLGLKTEFATKWINLCVSHVDEGIRDPITCYEYMGRFYVQEGNKRVSC